MICFAELSPKECFQLLLGAGPCLVIDVRTREEFSRGHLKGAENIDFSLPDFKEQLEIK